MQWKNILEKYLLLNSYTLIKIIRIYHIIINFVQNIPSTT